MESHIRRNTRAQISIFIQYRQNIFSSFQNFFRSVWFQFPQFQLSKNFSGRNSSESFEMRVLKAIDQAKNKGEIHTVSVWLGIYQDVCEVSCLIKQFDRFANF